VKGVGQLINWHGGGFLTLPIAPFVTKRWKILTTCCQHMPSHENFSFSFCVESAYSLTLLSDEISFDDWWDRSSRREISLDDWWNSSSRRVPDHLRKCLNSIILLGGWTLWNPHNPCVFDGEPHNLARALLLASEERHFGVLLGARGINHPLAQGLIVEVVVSNSC